MSTDVRVRRVYDNPSPDDGTRVLVDRVWPRGLRTVLTATKNLDLSQAAVLAGLLREAK